MTAHIARTVLLIPGQGAYAPGAFANRTGPDLDAVFSEIDQVAAEFGHTTISPLLTDTQAPSAADLVRTDPFAAQLAVFAAGIAGHRLAVAAGQSYDVLVGHSLGEVAALVAAGVFDLADGARLVAHRSVALADAGQAPGGMLAVELTADRAAHLVSLVGPATAVAVLNAPRQSVIAGPEADLTIAAALAQALGVRALRLAAPYPYHSPTLALAAELFAAKIVGIRQHPLRHPVYSPVARGYLTDTTDIAGLLVAHLTTQVRFVDAVRDLHADGARQFVEAVPGGLAKLVRDTVPDVETPLPGRSAGTVRPDSVPVPAGSTASSIQPAVPPRPSGPAPVGQVLEQLRDLYATTLGYPPEAITGDADLEADLGIDSLKRSEMLVKVNAHFALTNALAPAAVLTHSTLSDLAAMVVTAQSTGG